MDQGSRQRSLAFDILPILRDHLESLGYHAEWRGEYMNPYHRVLAVEAIGGRGTIMMHPHSSDPARLYVWASYCGGGDCTLEMGHPEFIVNLERWVREQA